jgi:hypothetical protein
MCILVAILKLFMEQSAVTKQLYDGPTRYPVVSLGRSIVAPMVPTRELCYMQPIDYEYGFELGDQSKIWNKQGTT